MKYTIIAENNGRRVSVPADDWYDANFIYIAFGRTLPLVEMWEGTKLVRKHDAIMQAERRDYVASFRSR